MKKLVLLTLAVMLVPSIVSAQCAPPTDIWFHSGYIVPETAEVFAGAAVLWDQIVMCVDPNAADICVLGEDDEGWVWNEEHLVCSGMLPDAGCWGYWAIDVTAALDAPIGLVNNVKIMCTHCDTDVCQAACTQDTMFVAITVVEPPPPIEIFQDTLTAVDLGVNEAYIPFQVCNGDPAADPADYLYRITSLGHVGAAINQSGTLFGVPGGTCEYAYGVIDASTALECDYDTLTIIGYVNPPGPGDFYDTCVQVIHVITPLPVPLFTTPVVTIMVLAMVLAAAVIMRKRVTSRA